MAPGRYQILAAINAVHTSARDVRDTDWSQVVALYDQLVRLDPSPIVALNRAIAVAELDGPDVALAAVDRLEEKLAGYHAFHTTRAELLRRLGHGQKARAPPRGPGRPPPASRRSWPAIPPPIRPAPSCCAGWATVRRPARRTTEPSSWPATPPRPPT